MNPAIIIPTFHQAAADRDKSLAESIYDHPTPLDAPGTLERCLESLQKVQGLGQIIITVSHNEAVEKVKGIVDRFPQMHTLVISESEAAIVQQRLEQLGFGDTADKIGVHGYSAVRNLGLVISNILGFDSVVFLDDDEVVEDPEFLIKAMYGLGKLTRREIPILAKSGYYLNAKGSFLSMSQNKWYNHYWQQGSAFNNWITKAMSGPRLSRSNHVCGGCLSLHKQAYMRVPFDPWIPRGEDLDYLINLRMYGSDVWFDNQWYLVHLPPQERHEGHRFRKDIFRWIYEYYKIEFSQSQIDLLQIKPSSLEPYPGPFLERGLESASREPRFCVLWRVPTARRIARRRMLLPTKRSNMPKSTATAISSSNASGCRSWRKPKTTKCFSRRLSKRRSCVKLVARSKSRSLSRASTRVKQGRSTSTLLMVSRRPA